MRYVCRLSRSGLAVLIAAGLWFASADVARAQALAPAPAPAVQTAVIPPLPNRLNTVLPSWLRLRGEFRERMEGMDNAGFVDGRDDLFYLSRFRVNATVTPSRWLSFQAQVQDARVAEKQVGATGAPFKAAFDLRMAFADVGTPTGHASIRVGRQELAFGEQRLVGHLNWMNAARTFDAGRVTLRGKRLQLDLFAASVVRILPDEWDKSGNGNRFYGAYATTASLVPKSTVEPYFFWRGDRGLKAEAGDICQPAVSHDGRPMERSASQEVRLRNRDGDADWVARNRLGPAHGRDTSSSRRRRSGRPYA